MWELRNGRIDVRPVNNAVGAVLYSTKEAAHDGEILLSDTLSLYRDRLTDEPHISLYPSVQEEHGVTGDVREPVSISIRRSRRRQ